VFRLKTMAPDGRHQREFCLFISLSKLN